VTKVCGIRANAQPLGGSAWPYEPCHYVLRAHAKTEGDYPNSCGKKWLFNYMIVILNDFFNFYSRFLPIFAGYWALFEARSWGVVGRWLPNSDLYKPGLIEAMARDSERVYDEYFPRQSHFYVGKLLRSAPLHDVSGSSDHPI
jgi:hypothetical protein